MKTVYAITNKGNQVSEYSFPGMESIWKVNNQEGELIEMNEMQLRSLLKANELGIFDFLDVINIKFLYKNKLATLDEKTGKSYLLI